MKFPEVFIGQRTPWRGILLYGVKHYLFSLLEQEKRIWQKHALLSKRVEHFSVFLPPI
jgi:hypothetical protein